MTQVNEKNLLHYIAYHCERCHAQFLGQGSESARYCNSCGALLTASAKQDRPAAAGKAMKVLIVEDALVIRMAVAKFVAEMGHAVVEAADGQEGLVAAESERPDLIISDIRMPNMDGLEFVERLRENEALSKTPIVMLTAEKNTETIRTMMKKGVADYILKDVANPAEFKNRLKKYL